MNEEEARERLDRLRRGEWPLGEIVEFYGYPEEFLSEKGLIEDGEVDRYELERKLLLEDGLLSTRLAAAESGLTEATVRDVYRLSSNELSGEYTPFPARRVDSELIVHGDNMTNWFREISEFNGTWGSLSHRTEMVADRLRELHRMHGVSGQYEVEQLEDVVSTRFLSCMKEISGWDIDEPFVASAYCAISGEPIALPHSETIMFQGRGAKPISLPPDRVGWHVLLEHDFIKSHTVGTLNRFEQFVRACGEHDE